MVKGTLEVLLVSAKGLPNDDFLSNIDPYAVISCRTQEKKSTVATDAGSNPQWNETFLFTVSHGVSEIRVRLMEKDNCSNDDFIGEATITLDALLEEGSIPPTSYNVVKEEKYVGEIKIGLNFVPQADRGLEEEDFGGWKQSAADED